jgi:hypothetical protein
VRNRNFHYYRVSTVVASSIPIWSDTVMRPNQVKKSWTNNDFVTAAEMPREDARSSNAMTFVQQGALMLRQRREPQIALGNQAAASLSGSLLSDMAICLPRPLRSLRVQPELPAIVTWQPHQLCLAAWHVATSMESLPV